MEPRDPGTAVSLMEWKHSIFDIYRRVRDNPDPQDAWMDWRRVRDGLFRGHPQSPLPEDRRAAFRGLDYFPYDPAMRVPGELRNTEPDTHAIATSGEDTYEFTRIAVVDFSIGTARLSLELYWLQGYGGGLFLPFRDATAGTQTYGAGRYLFDTVKGADLGMEGDALLMDFNFAYNPSCAYDPRWVCPLTPPPNRLDVSITAGERWRDDSEA